MHKAFFDRVFGKTFLLFSLLLWGFVASEARAYTTDLVLCLDSSGSMSAADWSIEKSGTAQALFDTLVTNVPGGVPDGSVRVTIVQFPGTSTDTNDPASAAVVVGPTEITTTAVMNTFNADLNGLVQFGGNTNIKSCIDVARQSLGCGTVAAPAACPADDINRIIDISTDGVPTKPDGVNCDGVAGDDSEQECAVAAALDAETSGIDVLNVIGVGNINQAFMEEWAFPAPVIVFDTALNQQPVIGDRGYVVLVDDFDDYAPTIFAKILTELSVQADISVVKTADQATVTPGGTLTYTLAVTNSDAVDVPNVVVTDTLPPGVTFVSADDNPSTADVVCVEASGIITCDIATLAGSSTTNIDVVVTVN